MELTKAKPMDLKQLSISQIAELIKKDWKNINYAAKPYVAAMYFMKHVTDNYGMESGIMIILYFLNNARSWHGETARLFKAELNRRCK